MHAVLMGLLHLAGTAAEDLGERATLTVLLANAKLGVQLQMGENRDFGPG